MFFYSNNIQTADNEQAHNRSILYPCLSVSFVGLAFVVMICAKYYFDLKQLEEKFISNYQANSSTIASTISTRFEHLYEGLYTIANLDSVRTVHDSNKKPGRRQINAIQKIYNLLYSSVQLAKVYIVPENFDPASRKHNNPTLVLDNRIPQRHRTKLAKNNNKKVLSEFREIKNHLTKLHANYSSTIAAASVNPAIIGKEILLHLDSEETQETKDSRNYGLTYTVPVYNKSRNLAGAVTGIIPTSVLHSLLPNEYYSIENIYRNFKTYRPEGKDKIGINPESGTEYSSDDFYTHSTDIAVSDLSGKWKLHTKIPKSVFRNQEQIKSTRFFTIVMLICTALLTTSIALIVALQIRQRRFFEKQNTVLESNIENQTKELKESEARSTVILNNAADGIIILNENLIIEVFNKAAASIFKIEESEVTGKHISILGDAIEKTFTRLTTENKENTKSNDSPEMNELICTRNNNNEFPLEIHVNQHIQGNDNFYTGIFRDISTRKQSELSITLAREEAELATKAKSEFLANMSHELRTPLNAILGYCEILQDEDIIRNNTAINTDLGQIHNAGKDLLHHVNSILDLSRIEAGKMELHLESFEVDQLIEEIIKNMKPTIEKNNNSVSLSLKCSNSMMDADRLKTQQIILNLLSNACKFTRNGSISITISNTQQFGIDWLYLTVCDTGIGMNNTQLSKIFNKFTQADSSTTKQFGGTGLGLSISQHFCEMMGGSIQASSRTGVGTEFRVKLPMAVIGPKVDPVEVRFSKSQDTYCSKRTRISRVLIVCNNPLSKDLTERFLTREGFFTDTVSSASQALSTIKSNVPDVIVIDENSLTFDSWGSINELKRQPCLADVPIIMLTKSDSKQLTEAIGATDYLQKPIQRNQLIDIITRYTRRSSGSKNTDGHILVIDDHAANRQLLTRMLEEEDIRVESAVNGLEGLEKVNQSKPALIFLDIVMPVMDGFEFAEKLRGIDEWQDIPVITITGHDLSQDEKDRLSSHVNTMLDKKDLEPAIILDKMRNALLTHLRKDRGSEEEEAS